jgi:hypothetical protein
MLDVIDYSKSDLLLFNLSLVQVVTTAAVLIFVPARAHHHEPYFVEGEHGSYKTAMILQLITTILIFVGENSEIFHSKVHINFSGFKRVTALILSIPLFIATLTLTVTVSGKELVWLLWLTISISVTAFQMVNLCIHVILEINNSKKAKQAF